MKYRGNRSRRWRDRLIHAATLLAPLCLFFTVTTCGDLHSLLLTIEAKEKVDKLQYKITDLSSGQVIYLSPRQTITRDISKPGQGLRVAVEFLAPGHYLAQVSARGGGNHFFSADYRVDGVREETAVLRAVGSGVDADGDGVPACGAAGVACIGGACKYLDCNDNNSKVHPFAKEICGDSLDNDCSAGCEAKPGAGDAECVDADGDGDSSDKDCDDTDPCRSSKLQEAATTCVNCPGGVAAGSFPVLPKKCLEKLKAAGKSVKAPYCGDGIDQDCSGKDSACITDGDCDCYPKAEDCDDTNPKVNKGMKEVCGDNIDNNCDGNIDEGCIRCDVDGDGYALPGTTDKKCEKMPKTDLDDFDAGKNPGTTASDPTGTEGGTILGALREWCSFTRKTKNFDSPDPKYPDYERDADHDGDKLPASQDGCPSKACDADGDGFQAKKCNPPLTKTDCDDTNHKIFPGAPDKCGDGVAQNCQSDRPCAGITDADKDGYSDKDDCNDADANIYPWALEKCDGKDNDCDKLIDEGNPDHLGKLIPTFKPTCNDDNDGECAPDCTPGSKNCSTGGNIVSGICACSSLPPTGTRDEKDRVKCSGENLAKSPTQRCWGAKQPQPEECDTKDHDCNEKLDDPTGFNFKDKGKPCSITGPVKSRGTCKQGKVVGCDLTKKVPYDSIVVAVMKKHKVEFNPNWVCSGDTLFPIPEVCNGRDEDCDGAYAIQDVVGVDVGSKELDEKDVDGDKFLACKGPCSAVGRTSLYPGLSGCADCDEKSPRKASTFPNANELCNDWDDNCKNGKSDDGKDECPAKGNGWACCSPQKACRNTLNDPLNCGTCGFVCDKRVADKCANGKCVCGTTGNPCKNGLNCVGGKCVCISGKDSKCAGGCCDGTTTCRFFLPGGTQSATKCGWGGQQCKTCDDKNDCTKDSCTSKGTCHNPNLANSPLVKCNSNAGRCWNGQCCTGCVGGGVCKPGAAVSFCGLGGVNCSQCKSGTQCKADICTAGKCGLKNKSNTTTCDDKQFCTSGDKCTNGVCGGTARDCSGLNDDCNTGTCSETLDKCYKKPKPTLTSCFSGLGKCYGGTCCTGCYDKSGGVCRPGTSVYACAKGGGDCKVCNNPTNVCQVATCSGAGVCGVAFKGAQAACTASSKSGQCYDAKPNPVCCTGCWDTGSQACNTGNTTASCGVSGNACQKCTAPNDCKTASCSAGGACGTSNKPNLTACTANSLKGQCYTGKCCTTCYNGSKCVSGTGYMCGTGGGNCVNCSQLGAGTCTAGVCTCSGCLNKSGVIDVCHTGTANKNCGSSGTCVDCTASGKTCNSTTKVCE